MQSRCCWPPDRRSAGWSRVALHLVPQPGAAQCVARPARRAPLARPAASPLAQRVGDVVEDAHRERVRLLEDHLTRGGAAPSPRSRRRPAPSSVMRPLRAALGVSSVRRLSERSSVVLPQPDGPISASTSPWRIGRSTVLTATFGAVGDRERPRPASARSGPLTPAGQSPCDRRARPRRCRLRDAPLPPGAAATVGSARRARSAGRRRDQRLHAGPPSATAREALSTTR